MFRLVDWAAAALIAALSRLHNVAFSGRSL